MNRTSHDRLAAARFLTGHAIQFQDRLCTGAEQKPPPWADDQSPERHGLRYRITLRKLAPGGIPAQRLSFDYWGSIIDRDNARHHVYAYEVLSCLSSDSDCSESFAEWCRDMGAHPDSIKDRATWRRCRRFARQLQAFFTPAELAELREIQ